MPIGSILSWTTSSLAMLWTDNLLASWLLREVKAWKLLFINNYQQYYQLVIARGEGLGYYEVDCCGRWRPGWLWSWLLREVKAWVIMKLIITRSEGLKIYSILSVDCCGRWRPGWWKYHWVGSKIFIHLSSGYEFLLTSIMIILHISINNAASVISLLPP
jgi:hypothetical protein